MFKAILDPIARFKNYLILVAVLIALGYIAYLKYEINHYKGVIGGYQAVIVKANSDIERLQSVNADNLITINQLKESHTSEMAGCAEAVTITNTKVASLLKLVEMCKSKQPKTITNTVYKLKECKVSVTDNNRTDPDAIIDILNTIGVVK